MSEFFVESGVVGLRKRISIMVLLLIALKSMSFQSSPIRSYDFELINKELNRFHSSEGKNIEKYEQLYEFFSSDEYLNKLDALGYPLDHIQSMSTYLHVYDQKHLLRNDYTGHFKMLFKLMTICDKVQAQGDVTSHLVANGILSMHLRRHIQHLLSRELYRPSWSKYIKRHNYLKEMKKHRLNLVSQSMEVKMTREDFPGVFEELSSSIKESTFGKLRKSKNLIALFDLCISYNSFQRLDRLDL